MKPDGWLMLSFPDGRAGFHLLDPGHPAGAIGSMSFNFGTPGYRTFTVRKKYTIPVYESDGKTVIGEFPIG